MVSLAKILHVHVPSFCANIVNLNCLLIFLDVELERPFLSLIVLEGMTFTLSCNPTILSEAITLCWTHNGTSIDNNMDGITFTPVNRNHNLAIQSASLSSSGIYHCNAAPSVSQSINVTVITSTIIFVLLARYYNMYCCELT